MSNGQFAQTHSLDFIYENILDEIKETESSHAEIGSMLHTIEQVAAQSSRILWNYRNQKQYYLNEIENPNWITRIQRRLTGKTLRETGYEQSRYEVKKLGYTRNEAHSWLEKILEIPRNKRENQIKEAHEELGKLVSQKIYLTSQLNEGIINNYDQYLQSHPELLTTIQKLQQLEELLETSPTIEQYINILQQISDPYVKKVLKNFLLKEYWNNSQTVLTIYSIAGVYQPWDFERYMEAYREQYKIEDRDWRSHNAQSFKIREIRRHSEHKDIWMDIINSIDFTNCSNFGLDEDCVRWGRCLMAPAYFSLPLEIQQYIVKYWNFTRHFPAYEWESLLEIEERSTRLSEWSKYLKGFFWKVTISSMEPIEAAKYVLSHPKPSRYSNYKINISDSFNNADYYKAATTYLDSQLQESYYVGMALQYLGNDEKKAYALTYFSSQNFDPELTKIYLRHTDFDTMEEIILEALWSIKPGIQLLQALDQIIPSGKLLDNKWQNWIDQNGLPEIAELTQEFKTSYSSGYLRWMKDEKITTCITKHYWIKQDGPLFALLFKNLEQKFIERIEEIKRQEQIIKNLSSSS